MTLPKWQGYTVMVEMTETSFKPGSILPVPTTSFELVAYFQQPLDAWAITRQMSYKTSTVTQNPKPSAYIVIDPRGDGVRFENQELVDYGTDWGEECEIREHLIKYSAPADDECEEG